MANLNTSIIPFDAQGAFGPALTLIYKSKDLTEGEIAKIAHIIEENFTALAAKAKDDKMGVFIPNGKEELCRFIVLRNSEKRPVLVTEMIGQQFFQSMQNHRVNEASHLKMTRDIVPTMLNVAKPHFPDLDCNDRGLVEWAARFVECYMTEGQISSYLVVSDAFMKERMRVAGFVSTLVKEQKLSETDFELAVHLMKQLMQNPNHQTVLEVVNAYSNLFTMSENPQLAANDVVGKLHLFQAKLFPKAITP